MAYFRCGGNGNTIMIDGQEYDDDLNLKSGSAIEADFQLPTMNARFAYDNCAVVLNNEIHMLGGINVGNQHYKYSNGAWKKVGNLPGSFVNGSAVVFNGEIYIFGIQTYTNTYTGVAKYNGSTWVTLDSSPIDTSCSCAVVFRNKIHILGGKQYNLHYTFDGKTWSRFSTLPYEFRNGCAVVLNGKDGEEIHILGSDGFDGELTSTMSAHYAYKWVDQTGISGGYEWVRVSTLPYKFYNGCAVVLNNEIHILGGDGNVVNNSTICSRSQHYIYSGERWKILKILPWEMHRSCAVVLNDNIYAMSTSELNKFSIIYGKFFTKL